MQVRGMFANYGFGVKKSAGNYVDQGGMKMSEVTDGLTNTIMMGEILPAQLETFGSYPGGWANYLNQQTAVTTVPINYQITQNRENGGMGPGSNANTCSPGPPERNVWNWGLTWGFKSKHAGGANFAFGDGSVHFISQEIDMKAYQLLGCRNDGQVVTVPD